MKIKLHGLKTINKNEDFSVIGLKSISKYSFY